MPTKLTQADVDEMTNAAVTADNGALITAHSNALTVQEPVGVSGQADPTDFVLPYVSLVQKMSKTGTPGMFMKSTGDETDVLDFVILHVARTRTYYDGDAGELLCASRDRIVGNPRGPELLAELQLEEGQRYPCAECPHWQDDQFQKVACKFDYLLTLYDLKAEEPFLFRAKGASLRTWRQRLSPILSGSQPPWFAAFEMSVKTVTNKKNQSWFEPEIKPIERYDTEAKATWAAYAEQFGVTTTDDETHMIDPDDLPFE